MKSVIAKGALALSVLGFTFGSTVVYESQWAPKILRTLASVLESEVITEENSRTKLNQIKLLNNEISIDAVAVNKSLTDKDADLKDLVNTRAKHSQGITSDEVSTKVVDRSSLIEKFNTFIKENPEHALKAEFQLAVEDSKKVNLNELVQDLHKKIASMTEAEVLAQKAAIDATAEKICKNTGLLETIKAQIAELLKDKEEVVAEVKKEEVKKEEVKKEDISASIKAITEYFNKMQSQKPVFSMAMPSMLSPYSSQSSMWMMMNMMNKQRFSAPSYPRSSYHYDNDFYGSYSSRPSIYDGFEYPGTVYAPAKDYSASSMFSNDAFMLGVPSSDFTRKIPRVKRGDGMQGAFSF